MPIEGGEGYSRNRFDFINDSIDQLDKVLEDSSLAKKAMSFFHMAPLHHISQDQLSQIKASRLEIEGFSVGERVAGVADFVLSIKGKRASTSEVEEEYKALLSARQKLVGEAILYLQHSAKDEVSVKHAIRAINRMQKGGLEACCSKDPSSVIASLKSIIGKLAAVQKENPLFQQAQKALREVTAFIEAWPEDQQEALLQNLSLPEISAIIVSSSLSSSMVNTLFRLPEDAQEQIFFMASENGNLALVNHLLSEGMHVGITNEEGKTALDCAAEGRQLEVVKALLKRNLSSLSGDQLAHSALLAFKTAKNTKEMKRVAEAFKECPLALSASYLFRACNQDTSLSREFMMDLVNTPGISHGRGTLGSDYLSKCSSELADLHDMLKGMSMDSEAHRARLLKTLQKKKHYAAINYVFHNFPRARITAIHAGMGSLLREAARYVKLEKAQPTFQKESSLNELFTSLPVYSLSNSGDREKLIQFVEKAKTPSGEPLKRELEAIINYVQAWNISSKSSREYIHLSKIIQQAAKEVDLSSAESIQASADHMHASLHKLVIRDLGDLRVNVYSCLHDREMQKAFNTFLQRVMDPEDPIRGFKSFRQVEGSLTYLSHMVQALQDDVMGSIGRAGERGSEKYQLLLSLAKSIGEAISTCKSSSEPGLELLDQKLQAFMAETAKSYPKLFSYQGKERSLLSVINQPLYNLKKEVLDTAFSDEERRRALLVSYRKELGLAPNQYESRRERATKKDLDYALESLHHPLAVDASLQCVERQVDDEVRRSLQASRIPEKDSAFLASCHAVAQAYDDVDPESFVKEAAREESRVDYVSLLLWEQGFFI